LNTFKYKVKTLLSMSSADILTPQQHRRGAARVKAHDRFAAQNRGLDTSLPPGPFLRPVGNVQACRRRELNVQDRDRDRRRHGSRPTWEVFSGSGVCVRTDECCSPTCCPDDRFTPVTRSTPSLLSALCAVGDANLRTNNFQPTGRETFARLARSHWLRRQIC
jgi:hypothetical protein